MASAAFRYELKYLIGPHQYHVLRHRLRHLLKPDPHAGPTGEYRITSLYFDDVADSALYEKLAGVQHRQKIRIRLYGGRSDLLMLEKKIRNDQGVRKVRCQIDRQIYAAMLAGEPQPLQDVGHPLLTEVAWQMTSRLLRPKLIVDYVREAYLYPQGNVRITFDKSLRSGITNTDLFRNSPLAPAPVDGMTILEVKYDAYLPRPVQDLLQLENLTRQSASKYVLCRTLAKTTFWEDN